MSRYTEISNVDLCAILDLIPKSNVYQRDLILGKEAWSGSTLKGKAKRWKGKYNKSQDSLIHKIQEAGYEVLFEYRKEDHNRLVCVITKKGGKISDTLPCNITNSEVKEYDSLGV